MCGIIGYLGEKNIDSVLLVGLERLSYRGYDSSGIAVIANNEIYSWKKQGKTQELAKQLQNMSLQGEIGIGHTRWATHGIPNDTNAHPHLSQNRKIALVHNGIIENFLSLKKDLQKKGYIFRSETDSEVIANLIEDALTETKSLLEAIKKSMAKVKGSYALAIISNEEPEKIIITKKASPLIIGLGENENYVASDINALLPHTKKIIYLDNEEIATITKQTVEIEKNNKEVKKDPQIISWDPGKTEKQGYPHYMLKEIHEQPQIIRNIIKKYISEDNIIKFKNLSISDHDLINTRRFIIQACGTSWHAGLIAKYLLEKYTNTLTEVDTSSELRYRNMIGHNSDIVMAISQSGETADTLACIHEAKSKFFKILSFINVKNSAIDRESNGTIYTHSNQEIGVASTKNYVAQLTCIFLFTLYLGLLKQTLSKEEINIMLQELNKIPAAIESILNQEEKIIEIADKYAFCRDFLFIGRGINMPNALEGALKLKEISYIHSTGYPAGELKHGPIALIDPKMPIVCLAPQTDTYEKMLSNIQEVKARKGKTIIIATENDTQIKKIANEIIYIPKCPQYLSPILSSIPLQLLSYHIAVKLDCDVDQPRNLAKSVTVE